MNSKYLLVTGGVIILLGGLWFARASWRGHHHLVSLNLRNVPLAEALRQVEKQTGEKIDAVTNLNTRITLKVTDRPLAYVLDRLAEQAGARWIAIHAVYKAPGALAALETALRNAAKIEEAGWSKLAPPDLPAQLPADGE